MEEGFRENHQQFWSFNNQKEFGFTKKSNNFQYKLNTLAYSIFNSLKGSLEGINVSGGCMQDLVGGVVGGCKKEWQASSSGNEK